MTLQIDTLVSATTDDTATEDVASAFIGGWAAARDYACYRPFKSAARVGDEAIESFELHDTENIFGPQVGLRNKLSAYRARRRLNRTFRRNQREFDNVLDAVAHDPASQRELQTSWTLGH